MEEPQLCSGAALLHQAQGVWSLCKEEWNLKTVKVRYFDCIFIVGNSQPFTLSIGALQQLDGSPTKIIHTHTHTHSWRLTLFSHAEYFPSSNDTFSIILQNVSKHSQDPFGPTFRHLWCHRSGTTLRPPRTSRRGKSQDKQIVFVLSGARSTAASQRPTPYRRSPPVLL